MHSLTLAGIPTLLLDREGWPTSPLYKLGKGKVVFQDWASLWDACEAHWANPRGLPGFGDWSPMLEELDPFRDGRGAERMGTYIHWLLKGFQAGLGREDVMQQAAELYAGTWGNDKVNEVKGWLHDLGDPVHDTLLDGAAAPLGETSTEPMQSQAG